MGGARARRGRADRGGFLVSRGARSLGDRIAPAVAWQLHAGLASLLRGQGQADAAARELRNALRELERPSRSLVLPERRSAFLADKWDM